MAIYDTFSRRRKKQEKAGQPDVYQYDTLPQTFRAQVIHIWRDAIGQWGRVSSTGLYAEPPANEYWRAIHDQIAREMGVFHLGEPHENPFERCCRHLMCSDTDGALDIIDLSFRVIDRAIRRLDDYHRSTLDAQQSPEDAINELNHRFREHGIGYQYEGGQIVRVDSQFVHAEAVKPALSLLRQTGFRGPEEEFLSAHEHYRKGNHKEAIADALKAFESTMKAICDAQKWNYPSGPTASQLIAVLLNEGLVPAYLQNHLSGLRTTLEAGLPTVRNKNAGHGQGANPVGVEQHVAAYALHLAATNIVFLVEAHRAKKP